MLLDDSNSAFVYLCRLLRVATVVKIQTEICLKKGEHFTYCHILFCAEEKALQLMLPLATDMLRQTLEFIWAGCKCFWRRLPDLKILLRPQLEAKCEIPLAGGFLNEFAQPVITLVSFCSHTAFTDILLLSLFFNVYVSTFLHQTAFMELFFVINIFLMSMEGSKRRETKTITS